MIKFFRQIRQNLIMENKTSKYLKYAIGEIVLVVIGILIALQINNWNERRKTENTLVAILKEVQHDLALDMQKSDELIAYYRMRDSIIQRVQVDGLSVEDYKNDHNHLLRYLILNAFHMKIHSNGYTKLMENVDNVPQHLKEIIDPLNEIYVYNKYEIDKFDLRIDKITDRMYDKLSTTKDWFYKLNEPQLTDEIIDYFRTDIDYKNASVIYNSAAWNNLCFHVQTFRANAIAAYLKINELLGSKEPLPDFMPNDKVIPTQEQLKEYAGIYKLNRVENFYGELNDYQFKFWIEKNLLVGAEMQNLEHVMPFYFEAQDKVTNSNIYNKIEFVRDSSQQIIGAIQRTLTGNGAIYFKKMKND
jgi:Family of unknown function (DUF6090)